MFELAQILHLLPKYNTLIGIAFVDWWNLPALPSASIQLKANHTGGVFDAMLHRDLPTLIIHTDKLIPKADKNPNWLNVPNVIPYRNWGHYFSNEHGHDTTIIGVII